MAAAMGDEENDDECASTLAEFMERVEEQELVRSLLSLSPLEFLLLWAVLLLGGNLSEVG